MVEVRGAETVCFIDVSLIPVNVIVINKKIICLGNYNEVKPIFQLIDVIVGLLVAVTVVKRLFD